MFAAALALVASPATAQEAPSAPPKDPVAVAARGLLDRYKAVLVVVTVLTKFLTGWYASSRVGGGTISRLRAGALLSARGEFSVIIAGLVALSATLPGEFEALVAAYVLLTATLGPILARYIEPIGWWWDQRPVRSSA